jgi:endonuclease YncB( thermonuclease family)
MIFRLARFAIVKPAGYCRRAMDEPMDESIAKWDAAMAASRLRNRRWRRLAWRSGLALILVSSLIDHLWGRNYFGDDWLRFDGRQAAFAGAIDGQTIAVRDKSGEIVPVRLLGVASFNERWDRRAVARLEDRLAGHTLTLLLESTQTRDGDGRLLAYVFTEDSEPVSSQLVGEGLALDDRRVPFAFHAGVDQAEAQARRKHLGLWATADPRRFARKVHVTGH